MLVEARRCLIPFVLVLAQTSASPAAEPEPPVDAAKAIRARCIMESFWQQDQCDRLASDGPGTTACAAAQRTAQAGCMAAPAVARALAEKAPRGWGTSKAQAIEVCWPEGQRAFLGDLRCADGGRPRFERKGNAGSRNPPAPGQSFADTVGAWTAPARPGTTDAHVVDVYRVTCGGETHELHFDMYHCAFPRGWLAPAGFTRPARTRSD